MAGVRVRYLVAAEETVAQLNKINILTSSAEAILSLFPATKESFSRLTLFTPERTTTIVLGPVKTTDLAISPTVQRSALAASWEFLVLAPSSTIWALMPLESRNLIKDDYLVTFAS